MYFSHIKEGTPKKIYICWSLCYSLKTVGALCCRQTSLPFGTTFPELYIIRIPTHKHSCACCALYHWSAVWVGLSVAVWRQCKEPDGATCCFSTQGESWWSSTTGTTVTRDKYLISPEMWPQLLLCTHFSSVNERKWNSDVHSCIFL